MSKLRALERKRNKRVQRSVALPPQNNAARFEAMLEREALTHPVAGEVLADWRLRMAAGAVRQAQVVAFVRDNLGADGWCCLHPKVMGAALPMSVERVRQSLRGAVMDGELILWERSGLTWAYGLPEVAS